MSDKAFEKAMGRIAIEAENQRQLEERRERRERIFDRIRSVGGFLLGAAVIGAGYYYRAQLQDYVTAKLNKSTPQMSAATGDSIKSIAADADKRDQVLDSLSK